ncbi:hypothetical protein F4824DRAFT_98277 [Ustulina deusta]|nr:hypothetical protein F4824DRAFT_98277 [Ustulina deusta]
MATFTPPLAPLTTIFTPPCPITWLLTTTKVPSQIPPFPTGAPASCDPPSWDNYVADRGFEYYSPAICPSGFFVGPSCIVTNPRTAQGFPAIQGGETAAYCVPIDHTCTSDTSDFRGGVWGVLRTATASGAQVTVGPAIQIRWREADLTNLETDPLTPGPRTTTQPSSTQAPPVETSTTIEDSSTSDPTTTSTLSSTPPTTTTTTTDVPAIPVFSTIPLKETTAISSLSSSLSSSPSLSPSSSSSSSSSPAPALSPATQESQANTTPTTTSAPPSGQQQSTNIGTPSQTPDGRGTGSSSSNFTVAAIVLTAILISIIAAYGGYSVLRRYRRYRAGETAEFFVLRAEARVRRLILFVRRRGRKKGGEGEEDDEKGGDERDRRRRWWKMPDAELGTEGPLPELGSSHAYGTKENPAELATVDRWSWRSRVSRIFTVRTHAAGVV